MNAQTIIVLVLVAVALLVSLSFVWRMKPAAKPEPRPEPKSEPEPKKHRLMVLGLGFTSIGPGETKEVTLSPQRVFRPKMLSIPSSIAENFDIEALIVGTDSVFSGNVPCECFTEVSERPEVEWPRVQVGEAITLQVHNKTEHERVFSGLIMGLGVRPSGGDVPLSPAGEALLRQLSTPASEILELVDENFDPLRLTSGEAQTAIEIIEAMPSDSPQRQAALDALRRARRVSEERGHG